MSPKWGRHIFWPHFHPSSQVHILLFSIEGGWTHIIKTHNNNRVFKGLHTCIHTPYWKMPEHICARCMYTTKQKINLRAHLSRQTPCQVANGGQDIDCKVLCEKLGPFRERKYNIECEWCKNKYSSATSVSHHKKSCSSRPDKQTIPNIDIFTANLQTMITRPILWFNYRS